MEGDNRAGENAIEYTEDQGKRAGINGADEGGARGFSHARPFAFQT
jgi:hypothetical protein